MTAALAKADADLRQAALRHGLVGSGPAGQAFLPAAKAFLASAREVQLAAHRAGEPGDVTAAVRSRAVDLLVVCLHLRAGGDATGLCLVALGGYGREELCPHSDIDLLLLPVGDPGAGKAAAEAVLYPLWDLGLKVGHSVRTPAEVEAVDAADLHFRVALLDRRAVAGPARGMEAVDAVVARWHGREGWRALAQRVVSAQRERRAKAGGSAFLQEPDLKNGVGALRDIHAIHWLAGLARRAGSGASLAASGLLPATDVARLGEARSLLLRLRCELHFQSSRPVELLSLERQDAVSAALGHEGDLTARIGSLMRGYLDAADHVRRCAELVEGQVMGEPEPPGEGPEIAADGFRVRRGGVARADHALVFDEDPLRLVRLFRLCQVHDAVPDRTTSLLVRSRAGLLAPSLALGSAGQALLREMLGDRGRVHPALGSLREHGLLDRLLPEFAGLHCLVQLEFYHRWTADVHTLRCLHELDQVFLAREGPAVRHREVLLAAGHPELLYATLLLHDIGKAEGIHGHAERGAAQAEAVLARLGYGDAERRLAEAVIRHHLVMGIYWQRHDLDDPANIARFAETVGEPSIVRHLFVHTRCDALATSPGLWTEGKDEQHNRLLRLTLSWMERGGQGPEDRARLMRLRADAETALAGSVPPDQVEAHFSLLPPSYFLHVTPAALDLHLRAVHALVRSVIRDNPDASLSPQVAWEELPRGRLACHIVTWDRAGLFGRIAGAFALSGINILSCRAFSRGDHVAIDSFRVSLPENDPEGAKARFLAALSETLVGRSDPAQAVQDEEARRARRAPLRSMRLGQEPVIRAYRLEDLGRTVLELQAPDRIGLLFRVGTAIRESGHALSYANVATERGYALDTFYLQEEPSVSHRPDALPELEARVRACLGPTAEA
ncbi:MAG: HD domain-containing protein [Opitutia bacterium]